MQSVCTGLREGFWPWANTDVPCWPATFDNSHRDLKCDVHCEFVAEECQKEVALGQFLSSFGPDLLPSMHSQPIGVVPKPHSENLRMVVDQSAEPHSLNSLIPKGEGRVRLDNMHDLGRMLRKVHSDRKHRSLDQCFISSATKLYVWKSDVSHAYRLMPIHVLWQILQIITIGDLRFVNRCNHFGNRAAGRIWGAFMGLVLWIAMDVWKIKDSARVC